MPTLVRPATREVRTWVVDSRRWEHYRPRDDDIIIATYPKCGTTWTQRLVTMLVFQSAEPRDIHDVSPWIDARFRQPIETVIAKMEAQPHRRVIKSVVPFDARPLYDKVRTIHVARDGRDACASWHNHIGAYTPAALAAFDKIGMEDEKVGRPHPRPSPDLRAFYLDWVSGDPARPTGTTDFFASEASYWPERASPNLLMVHYNDLKADLAGEMRRIAAFLEIECPDAVLEKLVEAGSFDAMQRDGDRLLPSARATFGGADRFLFKGTNGRWRDALTADDLALYEARVAVSLSPDCARWVEFGRLVAGDPDASLLASGAPAATGAACSPRPRPSSL